MSLRSFGSKAVVITVGVVALIAIALLFAQDQETIRLRSAVAASDPSFADYASVLTGNHVTRGDSYEVLTNGVHIFPPMLDAIRQARRRISLETYIYEDGAIADAFTEALADAARRGVHVRVIVDAVGASTMKRESVDALRGAGVELATYNALHWYSIEEINYRTHRKILVVDGEVGFTGGVGFAEHWKGNASSHEEWRDTQVRVTGPAVTRLEGAFYENWSESGTVTAPAVDLEAAPAGGSARSLVAWSSPTGGSNGVKLLYLLSIAAARQTLDIQTPYFVLDESTTWALLEACRRGVRVRLLLESDMTDAKSVKYASRADYERLLAAGARIHEYLPTMMHVKAMVVDGAWSLVGSANFDNRSFELNDEITVAIADRAVAARLLADFDADVARSRHIDLETWQARSWTERAHERFWGMFSELF